MTSKVHYGPREAKRICGTFSYDRSLYQLSRSVFFSLGDKNCSSSPQKVSNRRDPFAVSSTQETA